MDTLGELAAALGNDENFATTVSTSLGEKVPKTTTVNSKALSGNITLNAADVSAMSTSHAANAITSGNITD